MYGSVQEWSTQPSHCTSLSSCSLLPLCSSSLSTARLSSFFKRRHGYSPVAQLQPRVCAWCCSSSGRGWQRQRCARGHQHRQQGGPVGGCCGAACAAANAERCASGCCCRRQQRQQRQRQRWEQCGGGWAAAAVATHSRWHARWFGDRVRVAVAPAAEQQALVRWAGWWHGAAAAAWQSPGAAVAPVILLFRFSTGCAPHQAQPEQQQHHGGRGAQPARPPCRQPQARQWGYQQQQSCGWSQP